MAQAQELTWGAGLAGDLIIRSLDPHDRRALIPQVTTAGRRTQARITHARDRTEAELLKAFSPKSDTCCATCSPASRPTSEATARTPAARVGTELHARSSSLGMRTRGETANLLAAAD
jgi:hypothetical protein